MTDREDLNRVKRLPVTDEFINLLFENPENYYIKNGIPDGTSYKRMYQQPERCCTYVEFQNDDWEAVAEGLQVPQMEVEIIEINCQRCGEEMMYDEDNQNQYCPVCERGFGGTV